MCQLNSRNRITLIYYYFTLYAEFIISHFLKFIYIYVCNHILPAIVAVNPGQVKPVKIVVVIQNEAYYFWNIKATQVKCTQLQHFKGNIFS